MGNNLIYSASRAKLQTIWSEVSYRMQALRDNPVCAKQQFDRISDDNDPGLRSLLTFDINNDLGITDKSAPKPKPFIIKNT